MITQASVLLMRQSTSRVIALVEVFVLTVYTTQLEGTVRHVLLTTTISKEYPSQTQMLAFVSCQLQGMRYECQCSLVGPPNPPQLSESAGN